MAMVKGASKTRKTEGVMFLHGECCDKRLRTEVHSMKKGNEIPGPVLYHQ
jgi:hypothetical protein